MKIDGEGVKMAFYGIAAFAVIALGYSVYKKLGDVSKGLTGAADNTKAITERVLSGLGEVGKDIGASLDGAISSAKQAIGLGNDYEMPSQYGAYVLPRSQWPLSAKTTIDIINKQRGETGYSGWVVYSDGTITSPYREYITDNTNSNSPVMNASLIGRATNNGFLSANVNSDNYDMFKDFKSVGSLVDQIPY